MRKEDTPVCYYPVSFQPNSELLAVSFGSKRIYTTCLPHPDKKDEIIITTSLAEQLGIPDFIQQLYVFFHQQTFSLGPLIGIFTSGFSSFPSKPIGERSDFFQKLLSIQETLGVVPFIFGEQDLHWENQLINGLFFAGGKWINSEVPFPHVVYDRLPNRQSEKRKASQIIKERLQDEHVIPWYNPGFFNKLEIFDRLISDDDVIRYLPETQPFISFSQAEKMLSQYKSIYLKPKNGSLGLGIHQILYDRNKNYYYCRFREKDENKLIKCSSFEQLYDKVLRTKSPERFIIQQGISLLRVENLPIDFRVHTNKNQDGRWEVSAYAAKIAGSGSVTTHVHSGGVVKSLAQLFSQEEQQIYELQLKEAALALAHSIEKNVEGIIGEIGFDLGIDKNGEIWMFEANSKPGRSIFLHPDLKHFEFLTRKLALSFGIFLTEQAIKQPKESSV